MFQKFKNDRLLMKKDVKGAIAYVKQRISDLLQIPTFGIAPTISRPFVTLVKLRGMATLGN